MWKNSDNSIKAEARAILKDQNFEYQNNLSA